MITPAFFRFKELSIKASVSLFAAVLIAGIVLRVLQRYPSVSTALLASGTTGLGISIILVLDTIKTRLQQLRGPLLEVLLLPSKANFNRNFGIRDSNESADIQNAKHLIYFKLRHNLDLLLKRDPSKEDWTSEELSFGLFGFNHQPGLSSLSFIEVNPSLEINVHYITRSFLEEKLRQCEAYCKKESSFPYFAL